MQPTADLSPSTTYRWRVIAYICNPNDDTKEKSISIIPFFTTKMVTPAIPSLTNPLNGAYYTSRNPTLTWSASAGATDYYYKISTVSGNYARAVKTSSKSVSFVGLAADKTYYWQVSAGNTSGISAWSIERSFKTVPAASSAYDPILAQAYANKYAENDGTCTMRVAFSKN
jgi:hypothetical protein